VNILASTENETPLVPYRLWIRNWYFCLHMSFDEEPLKSLADRFNNIYKDKQNLSINDALEAVDEWFPKKNVDKELTEFMHPDGDSLGVSHIDIDSKCPKPHCMNCDTVAVGHHLEVLIEEYSRHQNEEKAFRKALLKILLLPNLGLTVGEHIPKEAVADFMSQFEREFT